MILIKELDLDKSFKRLIMELNHSYKITNPDKPENYAYAVGRLQSAIRTHVAICVGNTLDEEEPTIAVNLDDLKDINI